jgi:uncharacterized membrane protein YdjX (TVP38/TMEM64 family)
MGHPLAKPLLIVTFVLILPLALLALHGEAFAASLACWSEDPPSSAALLVIVVLVLASDVVLPVPSGPVATFAGSQLGPFAGAAAACLGMTLGATIAFALARRWGRPLAVRLAGRAQLAEAESACERHGAWLLLVARPLPVLAEASALLVGALQLSWSRFLVPVVASNAVIAVVYAFLGDWSAEQGWLPLAIGVSAAVPVALGMWLTRLTRNPKR